ncbi:hypothetical protein FE257_007467 [Aspergillus nanangensis]|uniref:Uncharacterized protein n=1 Tax=Aspergillus nanangensis TaxID=2582783 RepID=A0AAD4CN53_ASPNN|nr:hypothetical protein FE257_007467 [Aspergillus nanangensis]
MPETDKPRGFTTDKGQRHGWFRSQRTLPAWLDHFNGPDLKILFRCWVAAWVASLLMFIGPALHKIGIATFFGALLLYIVPPGGILYVYLLASLSLLFGMCLGWAWGLLTMKAALAARPESQTQALLQQLQQQAIIQAQQTGQSPSAVAQELVHDGFLLDARITVVFYVLICLFVYVVSRIRVANPKFVLVQLFSIIVADLFLLFGPTVPSFTPLLARVLVEPGAIGIGLGVACCLLFFPQSTSYACLAQIEQLVRLAESPLRCTRARFARQDVSLQELQAERSQIIAGYKAIGPALAFLPLDLSRGRWGPDDLKDLHQTLRQAMVTGLALLDFHIARITSDQKLERLRAHAGEQSDHPDEKHRRQVGRRQLQESEGLLDALKNPDQGAIHSQTLDALQDSTADLLDSCSRSVDLISQSLHTINSTRWVRRRRAETQIKELIEQVQSERACLGESRATSGTETTEQLLRCHSDLFGADGSLKSPEQLGPHALRGLVIGMVVEERIIGFAEAIEAALDHLLRLLRTRTANRWWLPFRLQYWIRWVINSRQAVPISELTTDQGATDPDEADEQAREAYRQLRVSRGQPPVTRRRSRPVKFLVGLYKWVANPGGMYALRMVVVTIACAIPASLPHTAGFYYREKGIWGLITAQTTMMVYMADLTFSMVLRAIGTVLGGVMAMVAWYIGSGNGPGNAYGMAAITAAMTVVLMWWRLFLPPTFSVAAIMSGATFILVVGFSYDDGHIQQYGLPGRGYAAFWKRLVSVLLGFVAAFVVQLFPRPPSTTRHVCKTLSNTVRTLSDHYALLLSHWGRTDLENPVGAVADKISLGIAETLLALGGPIGLLKFEMSLGPFDQRGLATTKTLCQAMNQALSRLLMLSTTLPLEFQQRLMLTVGLLDQHVIGDIMAVLGIIEQALTSGLPLPEKLPTPLIGRCYESWDARHLTVQLTATRIREENYRRYCVAVSSYLRFLSTIDDLVLVLKGTLGESHIIDRWQNDTPV